MRIVSLLWIFFFQSWPLFRRRLAPWRQTLQAGHFSRSLLLQSTNARAVNCSGELFWNDVTYFFPMNINFCNLSVERRRNGNDIFYLRNCWRSRIILRSQHWLFRNGGNEFFRNFLLLEADACVNWTDRSLSSFFSEKKNVTSNRCCAFAVVEFEDIDVTFS